MAVGGLRWRVADWGKVGGNAAIIGTPVELLKYFFVHRRLVVGGVTLASVTTKTVVYASNTTKFVELRLYETVNKFQSYYQEIR